MSVERLFDWLLTPDITFAALDPPCWPLYPMPVVVERDAVEDVDADVDVDDLLLSLQTNVYSSPRAHAMLQNRLDFV